MEIKWDLTINCEKCEQYFLFSLKPTALLHVSVLKVIRIDWRRERARERGRTWESAMRYAIWIELNLWWMCHLWPHTCTRHRKFCIEWLTFWIYTQCVLSSLKSNYFPFVPIWVDTYWCVYRSVWRRRRCMLQCICRNMVCCAHSITPSSISMAEQAATAAATDAPLSNGTIQ